MDDDGQEHSIRYETGLFPNWSYDAIGVRELTCDKTVKS